MWLEIHSCPSSKILLKFPHFSSLGLSFPFFWNEVNGKSTSGTVEGCKSYRLFYGNAGRYMGGKVEEGGSRLFIKNEVANYKFECIY